MHNWIGTFLKKIAMIKYKTIFNNVECFHALWLTIYFFQVFFPSFLVEIGLQVSPCKFRSVMRETHF